MVDIPTTVAEAMSATDALGAELEKTVSKALGIDEVLQKLAEDNSDEFQSKLMQMRSDWKEFYNEKGEIDLKTLQERLSWKERMALFVSHYLSENIVKLFFGSDNAKNVTTMPFSDVLDYYTQEARKDKATMVKDGHLIWKGTDNPFTQISMVFSLGEMFSAKSKESKEPFPLPPKSRIVVPARPADGAKMTPTKFNILTDICASKGIKLDMVNYIDPKSPQPGEPGDKEIQVIFIPSSGLPLGPDGKIDQDQLNWYKGIYESGVHAQWMLTPKLLAAIFVAKGESVEAAMTEMQIPLTDSVTKDLLATIPDLGKAPEAPAPAPDLLASVKGADGKLNRATLQDYQKKYEDKKGEWLTAPQKAAVFVLQGAPSDQALASAGILTTDPSYATLKTDLDTLNQ